MTDPSITIDPTLLGTPLIAGQTLGHYQLLEQCGSGGMGVVFRAYDKHLERDVALKVLPRSNLDDSIARLRFRNEALTLAKLNHPNIATVHDFDTQDGTDFLIMEYVYGEALSTKLQGGALSEKEALSIARQITGALQEAHEHNVIHRDLKPGNVLLTHTGRVKVADFGVAKILTPRTNECPTESLLQIDFGAGTVPYMAPEQLRGEPMDARSDIWGAGCVLYEMTTGSRPFEQIRVPNLTDAIFHENPVGPRIRNESLSAETEFVILKCLQKNLKDRYQSAEELRLDLNRINDDESTGALPEPSFQNGLLNRLLQFLLFVIG